MILNRFQNANGFSDLTIEQLQAQQDAEIDAMNDPTYGINDGILSKAAANNKITGMQVGTIVIVGILVVGAIALNILIIKKLLS